MDISLAKNKGLHTFLTEKGSETIERIDISPTEGAVIEVTSLQPKDTLVRIKGVKETIHIKKALFDVERDILDFYNSYLLYTARREADGIHIRLDERYGRINSQQY